MREHRSAPRGDGDEERRARIGVRLHRALGAVLALGPRAGAAQIEATVRALMATDEATWRLQAAWAEIYTGVLAYLTRYEPAAPWRLTACELPLGDAVADLVFTDAAPGSEADGRYLVDELKTVTSRRALTTRRNLDQYHRLLEGGSATWGERFAGLRIVAPAVGVCLLVREPAELIGLLTAEAA